MYCLLQ